MTAPVASTGSGRAVSPAHRILGVVQLVRPFNFLLLLLGTLLGGVLVAGADAFRPPYDAALLIAMISAALVGGGANAINDVFDLRIDRVNRPDRPLPSGKVSRRTAVGVWAVATAAGIAMSFLLSPYHVLIAIGSAILLYGYSARFKKTSFIGNVIVAASVALALVYGGWAVGSPLPSLVGAAFAFLTILAREVVKDVEDEAGDRLLGVQSIALTRGSSFAFGVAAVIVAVTVLLTPVPYLFLGYGNSYLMLVLAADVFLLLSAWSMIGEPRETPSIAARSASGYLKLAMVAGMLALAAVPFRG